MPFGAAAILAGGTLLGSLITGNAAQSAAQTQANAANRAGDLQLQEFNTTQGNLYPFLRYGQGAASILSNDFLGINPDGSFNSANASLLQNPLTALGPVPRYNMPAYTAQMYQRSPGYNAALQGGVQALQDAGTTTTGALSGNVLRALQGTGTQLANQDYQQNYQNYANNYMNQFSNNNANFWSRYNAANQNQQNIFNRLAQIMGGGQSAAVNQGSQGLTAAGNAGNAIIGGGNALAAGQIGQANAFTGGLGSLLTGLQSPINNNSLLAALMNGGGGGGFTANDASNMGQSILNNVQ